MSCEVRLRLMYGVVMSEQYFQSLRDRISRLQAAARETAALESERAVEGSLAEIMDKLQLVCRLACPCPCHIIVFFMTGGASRAGANAVRVGRGARHAACDVRKAREGRRCAG